MVYFNRWTHRHLHSSSCCGSGSCIALTPFCSCTWRSDSSQCSCTWGRLDRRPCSPPWPQFSGAPPSPCSPPLASGMTLWLVRTGFDCTLIPVFQSHNPTCRESRLVKSEQNFYYFEVVYSLPVHPATSFLKDHTFQVWQLTTTLVHVRDGKENSCANLSLAISVSRLLHPPLCCLPSRATSLVVHGELLVAELTKILVCARWATTHTHCNAA